MGRYWLQTLGCPKNQVDSDKLEGYLEAQGYVPAPTCGGRSGRREHLRVHRGGSPGVDRHRAEPGRDGATVRASWSRAAWPNATATSCATHCPKSTWSPGSVVTSWRPHSARLPPGDPGRDRRWHDGSGFDLLELPRPAARAPWAYVKVAEGCDRICGFCAIPSFRGKQRSRTPDEILAEVDALVGPAPMPSAAPARDRPRRPGPGFLWAGPHRPGPPARIAGGPSPIAALTRAVAARVERTRLLYLYPSGLDRRADRDGDRDGRALLRSLAPARVASAARRYAALG